MINSFWNIECDRKNQKIRILKKQKCWRYHFTHLHQNPQSYEVWFLRYGVRQTEFFVILGHFLPFYPLTTWTIKILKNWNNHLEMSSFYTCVPKITIIWCMLPEIWSVTDIIFVIFGPFTHNRIQKLKFGKNVTKCLEILYYLHMCIMNEDPVMYSFWDIRHNGQSFCHFGEFWALWPS